MNFRKTVLLLSTLWLTLSTVGCITAKPRSRSATDQALVIDTVPVRQWGDNTCGSAALSSVLHHYGIEISEEEFDARFDKGRAGGVVSLDLLIAARELGLTASMVRGDLELLADSVSRGKPVIIMLRVFDAPGTSRDLYHYVVVDGYDPQRELLRMHFGDARVRWAPLRSIERAWNGGGNAALLISRNGENQLDPAAEMRRAVALERSGNPRAAAEVYRRLLAHDASEPTLVVNLGNALRQIGQEEEAVATYRMALAIAPDHPDALNNLAWALYEQGELKEAIDLARRAVTFDSADRHHALDTLAHIEAARGNCPEAERIFREAASLTLPGEEQDHQQYLTRAELARHDCAAVGR
jgi:hypothetical protein